LQKKILSHGSNRASIHNACHIRYNERWSHHFIKEEAGMRTLLVLGVMIAFLTAIFTAGYEDKPGVKN
jgi:hypothetical protein